jgi:predicted RNase H-like HicB family nuclease
MKTTKKKVHAKPARKFQLQVVIEIDEDGRYVAWCPALNACYTQGDTFEEAMENIRDVIAMAIEDEPIRSTSDKLRFPEVILNMSADELSRHL